MIQLGLARIANLVSPQPPAWRAIHVAGTNGKGSICHYIAALLGAAGLRCGLFTTPHLVHKRDSIKIGLNAIDANTFNEAERRVRAKNDHFNIGASEFEVLTATAFDIFSSEKVPVAVIECGMGGRRDATNILVNPLVTVISQIALDHKEFLGPTIEDIAYEKAGIIKPGVPVVIDGNNASAGVSSGGSSAMQVIESVALENDSPVFVTPRGPPNARYRYSPWQSLDPAQFSLNEQSNLNCAATAVGLLLPQLKLSLYHTFRAKMLPALRDLVVPGRLHFLDISKLTQRTQPILLDGAHNPKAAHRLGQYVKKNLRVKGSGKGVTWVLAASHGRAEWELLRHFVCPNDNFIFSSFGPVDGMPWIRPTEPSELMQLVQQSKLGAAGRLGQLISAQNLNIRQTLQRAVDVADGGPLVVTGSLYLVGEVLRAVEMADNQDSGLTAAEIIQHVDKELEGRRWPGDNEPVPTAYVDGAISRKAG